jgi:hypothetical protein
MMINAFLGALTRKSIRNQGLAYNGNNIVQVGSKTIGSVCSLSCQQLATGLTWASWNQSTSYASFLYDLSATTILHVYILAILSTTGTRPILVIPWIGQHFLQNKDQVTAIQHSSYCTFLHFRHARIPAGFLLWRCVSAEIIEGLFDKHVPSLHTQIPKWILLGSSASFSLYIHRTGDCHEGNPDRTRESIPREWPYLFVNFSCGTLLLFPKISYHAHFSTDLLSILYECSGDRHESILSKKAKKHPSVDYYLSGMESIDSRCSWNAARTLVSSASAHAWVLTMKCVGRTSRITLEVPKSAGMLCRVDWYKVTDVSKRRSASIFTDMQC